MVYGSPFRTLTVVRGPGSAPCSGDGTERETEQADRLAEGPLDRTDMLPDNCSSAAPTSDVYFADLSIHEKISIGVATALCLTVLGLFADQAHFVIKKYQTGRSPEIKIKSLWLTGIYPIFSLAALLAIYVPRAALLCDLASSIYLAVCLFHFTSLMILYSGGVPRLLDNIRDDGFNLRTPPCCCCCFCCPVVSATWTNLARLRVMVFQTSFLQPFISFITLVLWLDEKYVKGKIRVDQAYLYLSVVNAVSTLTAMYGLLVLFRTVRGSLRRQSIGPKFLVLQLVLIIHNLQGFVFVTLANNNIPPCLHHLSSDVRSNVIQRMIVVAEMLVLAVLARLLYRRPHHVIKAPSAGHDTPTADTRNGLTANDDDDDKDEDKEEEGENADVVVREGRRAKSEERLGHHHHHHGND